MKTLEEKRKARGKVYYENKKKTAVRNTRVLLFVTAL